MKKIHIILSAIFLVNMISAISLYSYMPEKMASHWNINGEVDGYMTRYWGMFLMPTILLFLILLLLFLPKTDPSNNLKKFSRQYELFIVVFSVFMTYLYMLTLAWNLGFKFSFNISLAPAFGALFYSIGLLIEKAKQNWFAGIRTPWTLSSKKVWEKTHKLGSKMFKACGFLSIIGVFFSTHTLFFMILPAMFTSIFLVLYSYFEWKKLK